MKKILFLIIALVLVLTLAAASADTVYRTLDDIKASGTVNIGVFSDKNPFGYVDEYGEYQGYDVYFARRQNPGHLPAPAGAECLAAGKGSGF